MYKTLNSSPSFVALENLEPRTLFTAAIKIMPLGDSITASFAPRESYRYDLWNDLQNAGFKNIDFVGSQHGVTNGLPENTNFDMDHEGHSGWTAEQILLNVAGWAKKYRPDVVLMHLGTNDIRYGESNSTTVDDLKNVIATIRKYSPKASFIVSRLIPNEEAINQTRDLNNLIRPLVKSMDTTTSRVAMVDPTVGFDVAADTFDGLHPSESGERKMADAFFAPLKSFLSSMATPAPAPLPAGQTSLSSLTRAASQNGYGPIEIDQSNGEDLANDGKVISINGKTYDRGLGTNANSRVDYVLNGRQRYFAADLGIDDEAGASGGGTVVFKVYADGKRIFSSQVITGGEDASSIQLNIKGVRKLTLIVSDAGDGNANDHADWASARLIA